MKSLRSAFLAIILVLTFYSGYPQEYGNFRIAFNSNYSSFNFQDNNSMGFSVEYFLGPHISLDYNYAFGKNKYNETCYYFPGTVAGFVLLFGDDILYDPYFLEDYQEVVILSLIIPEGISFHTYPRYWLEVAPYFYPFSADYNFSNYDLPSLSWALGIKVYFKPLPRLSVSSGFGIKNRYSNAYTTQNYSFSAGWLF